MTKENENLKDSLRELGESKTFTVIKVIALVGGLLLVMGGLFQILTFTAKNYKDLSDQIKRP